MFLNHLTIVDHAYIDDTGEIIGGSFNPSFLVSGDVDPTEQVVVDFSTVKKQIKNIVDCPEKGFDHKLWVLNDSAVTCTEYSDVDANGLIEQRIMLVTPIVQLDVPLNAVKFVDATSYTISTIGNALAKYVTDEIKVTHPSVTVQVVNDCNAHVLSHFTHDGIVYCAATELEREVVRFSYVHGLKDSTSWGCKNIAHGHLSFIQLFTHNALISSHRSEMMGLEYDIAQEINGTTFIRKENVVHQDEDQLIIEYTTESRGRFKATYNLADTKVVVLDTETTIENLVSYIKGKFSDRLKDLRVDAIFVSEGLSKGAFELV